MIVNPLRILIRPFRVRSLILLAGLAIYVTITLVIFFQAVVPSFIEGTTSELFAVDSTLYVSMADSLREGCNDPLVLGAMLSFPNTLWAPVFLSLILNNAFLVMLTNYTIFAASIFLLKKSFSISSGALVLLLLLNPTTTTSLLCVNKEILDLFSVSLFLYSRERKRNGLLLVALGVALLNRWEICAVLLVLIIAESRLNPWRRKRLATLLLLVVAINFITPLMGAKELAGRFEEVQQSKTLALLGTMQMHYLYAFAVVPKIADNLFGELMNPLVWEVPVSWQYIMFFNNFAYAIVVFIAAKKRVLTLQNNFVYFGALGSVLVAQTLALQPRYFYFVYVLLCLQVAQKGIGKSARGFSLYKRSDRNQGISLITQKEMNFGQFN